MKKLRMVAFDIDGVLLKDTFSPVIKALVEKYGVKYSREIENSVFSQRRKDVSEYLVRLLNPGCSPDEILSIYFRDREEYIRHYGGGMNPGMPDMLELVRSLGLRMIVYGGLPEEYYEKEMKGFTGYFEGYVCTNDFRPGLREITDSIYQLDRNEILFLDDVAKVADAAKKLNIPFIGMQTLECGNFQREEMEKAGVRYLIRSLKEIDRNILNNIDDLASRNEFWQYK